MFCKQFSPLRYGSFTSLETGKFVSQKSLSETPFKPDRVSFCTPKNYMQRIPGEKGEKSTGENSKDPVETAPRICRLPSLVVVERVLIILEEGKRPPPPRQDSAPGLYWDPRPLYYKNFSCALCTTKMSVVKPFSVLSKDEIGPS